MDAAEQRLHGFLASIEAEFPRFCIVEKHKSRLHRSIDIALRIVTLGRNKTYLEGFYTTLGQTLYVTSGWAQRSADARYQILRHEVVHMRQFKRLTWPGMILCYLFLPLPIGLAYFRARLEWQAYAETIRAGAELRGLDHVRHASFRREIVNQFTGPAYGWMWPFRRHIEAWYDDVLHQLEAPEPTPQQHDEVHGP